MHTPRRCHSSSAPTVSAAMPARRLQGISCGLLLLLLKSLATAAAAGPGGSRPAELGSAAHAAHQRRLLGVPGQAFHDWRSKLLARNFTSSTISAAQAATAATAAIKGSSNSSSSSSSSNSSSVPGSTSGSIHDSTLSSRNGSSSSMGSSDASSSSSASSSNAPGNSSSANHPMQPRTPQHQWINIVGYRDELSELPGPPKINTTHEAALQRLTAARAVLAEAAARQAVADTAQAAAHTAAAAAASAAAMLSGPSLPGSVQLPNPTADAPAAESATNAPAESALQADASSSPEAATGSSSSSSSSSSTRDRMNETSIDQVELTLMSYVRRSPGSGLTLQLNGKPWLMTGFDVPHALQLAVQENKRHQLLELMDQARGLGFNTMRVWAFGDGGMLGVRSAVQRAWQEEEQAEAEAEEQQQQQQQPGGSGQQEVPRLVMQPVPGILNAIVMSAGLDWLVHVAGLRGIKLLLVLTNGGSATWGGMKQYTDWVDPALTVTDFYGNDTVKSVFLDFLAGIVGHASSLTGVPLREDPVVAGWQLAEAPSHPGHPSSEALQGWLKQMGTFLREKAPHQLVLSGLEGLFGQSSPHHLQHNPYTQVFDSPSRTPHAYSALCSGTDFWLHHMLPELDIATAAVLPDKWLACSNECKLEWTRAWLRAHLREALRLQKPLLLTGVGALRPQPWRSQLLAMVQQEVARAVRAGHPVAGILLSGLSHAEMPDDSGWGIYDTAAAVHKERLPLADDTTKAVAHVTWRRFANHAGLLSCLAEQARGGSNELGEAGRPEAWVDGWQGVLQEVGRIGQLPGCVSSGSRVAGRSDAVCGGGEKEDVLEPGTAAA